MGIRNACPDGGTCHHMCGASITAPCFRVLSCLPLSGVFPEDRWPDATLKVHRRWQEELDD